MEKQAINLAAIIMLALCPPSMADANTIPSPSVALKGLKSAKLMIGISKDAKIGLKSVGYRAAAIEDSLTKLAKQKLELLGVAVQSVPNDYQRALDDTTLTLVVDTDMTTGTYFVDLDLDELVTIARAPDTKLVLTTWTRSQHPRGNEGPSIEASATDLLDQFVTEYLAANKQ